MTTEQVETYISEQAGFDFDKVFDQYLRGTDIPVLKYSKSGKTLTFNFEKVVPGFSIPLVATVNGTTVTLTATDQPQTMEFEFEIATFEVDRNFYVDVIEAKR